VLCVPRVLQKAQTALTRLDDIGKEFAFAQKNQGQSRVGVEPRVEPRANAVSRSLFAAGGRSRLKQPTSALTARVMKRSAEELQGDQELIKLLDYEQDEMLLEEVSKLFGHESFVVDMVRRLGDVLKYVSCPTAKEVKKPVIGPFPSQLSVARQWLSGIVRYIKRLFPRG